MLAATHWIPIDIYGSSVRGCEHLTERTWMNGNRRSAVKRPPTPAKQSDWSKSTAPTGQDFGDVRAFQFWWIFRREMQLYTRLKEKNQIVTSTERMPIHLRIRWVESNFVHSVIKFRNFNSKSGVHEQIILEGDRVLHLFVHGWI